MGNTKAIQQTRPPRLKFSHFGMSVSDIPKMEAFYTEILGFTVTDRGTIEGGVELVFMSRDPDVHHQIVLVSGKPDNLPQNTADPRFGPVINQISFAVDGLDELRILHRKVLANDIRIIMMANHGIAWSIYIADPEGNMLEFFVDSPWYMHQPCLEPLDLDKDDSTLYRETLDFCKGAPGFQSYAEWRIQIARKMAADQAAA